MESLLCGQRRVAFFGGSFDPPHEGHLAVARAARAALDLDLVLFAPVGVQPLKPMGSAASFEHRLAMTALAVAGDADFAVSLIDAPKADAAPNYTIDTLMQLRAEIPADGALFCLMGADSFYGLRQWHRAAEIPFVAPLIVASRPGQALDELRDWFPKGLALEGFTRTVGDETDGSIAGGAAELFLLRNAAGDLGRFYLLPNLHVEISASQIRAWLRSRLLEDWQAAGGPAEGQKALLPAAVLQYIRERGLYRAEKE